MAKKISKRKEAERKERLEEIKKHRWIIIIASIIPFVFTALTIILYMASEISFTWLFALTASLWLALGGLYVYAYKKKWGFFTPKGVATNTNYSIVTVYNIVLIYILAAFYYFLMFIV